MTCECKHGTSAKCYSSTSSCLENYSGSVIIFTSHCYAYIDQLNFKYFVVENFTMVIISFMEAE